MFEENLLIPSLDHIGGGLLIWACFVVAEPGHLDVIEFTRVYQSILQSNKRLFVRQLITSSAYYRTVIPTRHKNLQQIE